MKISYIRKLIYPDMHTPKLGLNSFNVLRKDRSSVSSAKESGGGVLVAVSNIYRAYEFVSTIDNVECWLFVKAHRISSINLSVLVEYILIPSIACPHLLQSFYGNVEEVYSSCGSDTRIIIAGDFNQPCMDWTFPSPVPINMA